MHKQRVTHAAPTRRATKQHHSEPLVLRLAIFGDDGRPRRFVGRQFADTLGDRQLMADLVRRWRFLGDAPPLRVYRCGLRLDTSHLIARVDDD